MSENVREINKYDIPYKVNSALKWHVHLIYGTLVAMFIGCMFIPIEDTTEKILYKGFLGLIALIFGYAWLYTGLLKKQYLELTEDYIKYKTAFGVKLVKWTEIYDIQMFTQSHNTMLGIILKEKIRKRKDSFGTVLSDLYGGVFSIRIAPMIFPNMNIERLYSTVVDKLVEVNKDADMDIENNVDSYHIKDEDDRPSNYPIALIKSLLLSLAIGIGYGLTIYFFKSNIIIIPIFGSMAIMHTYLKNYKEEKINIFARIIFGLINALQVFAGAVVVEFLSFRLHFSIDNIIYIIVEYSKYVFRNPSDQAVPIIMAVICFFIGAVQGHTFKIEKVFKKLFMKKTNNIYYKKDGRIMTIYLKDPADYNEEEEGKFISQINDGCLIEKKGKKVKGFYIPVIFIEDLGISMENVGTTSVDNKSFYKFDLGGGGEYYSYTYPCILILNSNKQVELIQIQL